MKSSKLVAMAAALAATAALPAAASAETVVYTRGVVTASGSTSAPDEIWRANADGSNQRPVLQQYQTVVRDPVLSPDGRAVAFTRDCDSAGCGIYTINVNGANERVVLPNPAAPGVYWGRPYFHPDGRSLLVTKRVLGAHPTYIDQFSIWRINLDGTGLTPVVSWSDAMGPDQSDATYSPDGTRIAFSASVTPTGAREGGKTLWSANADGSNPTQLTTVPAAPPYANSQRTFGGRPAWSPNGTMIAFTWEKLSESDNWNTEIGVINAGGGGAQLITQTGDHYEYEPSWSSQGRIAYSRVLTSGSASEVRSMDTSGGTPTTLLSASDHGFQSPSFGVTAPMGDSELLEQYAPLVKYDIQETYRADSAAAMTDNYVLDSRGRLVRQNLLKTASGTILAAAWPGDRKPDLSLGYLGSYPGAVSSHLIDAPNTYAEDAQRMHANPVYANKTYGHVVNYADGTKVLQYWLFYYNNPKTYFTIGEHEGDWEMVQVHVDASQTPVRATYSQHAGGERCDWAHVQRVAGRPVVYVGEGSHASYFSAGYHLNEGANDTSGGDGAAVVPSVVDVGLTPAWLSWPGKWGGSASSPPGPKQQTGKWNDPLAWSTTVDGCTESQTQPGASAASRGQLSRNKRPRTGGRPAPPPPRVSVRRVGNRAMIHYRFDSMPRGGRRPKVLVTSVDGRKTTPTTQHTLVDDIQGGLIRQPLGHGRAPFRVLVRSVGHNGRRSSVVSVPLR